MDKNFEQYQKHVIKKDKVINIRISSIDLQALQTRAVEEGLPYQTLISSVLHKYVSGRFVDLKSITSTKSMKHDYKDG